MMVGSDKSIENHKYQPGLLVQVVILATQVTKARETHIQDPHGLQNKLWASLHGIPVSK